MSNSTREYNEKEKDADFQRALQDSARQLAGNPAKAGVEHIIPVQVESRSSDAQESGSDEDEELQKALRLSLQYEDSSSDNELKKALQMSLECKFIFPLFFLCFMTVHKISNLTVQIIKLLFQFSRLVL